MSPCSGMAVIWPRDFSKIKDVISPNNLASKLQCSLGRTEVNVEVRAFKQCRESK